MNSNKIKLILNLPLKSLAIAGTTQLFAVLLVFLLSNNSFATDESVPNHIKISLDQATKKIIKDDRNRVLGAETELIDNREVHVIKVLTPDGRIRHFKIDAETGEVINR